MSRRQPTIVLLILLLLGSTLFAASSTSPAKPLPPISLGDVSNPSDIVFMFPVSRPLQLTYQVKNSTADAIPLTVNFSLVDRKGTICGTQKLSVNAAANSATPITCQVPLAGLLYGQYVAKFIANDGTSDVIQSSKYVGVMSTTDLPKAKPGEFMFGIDASLQPAYQQPPLLRYTQLLGTDLVRGGVATWRDRIKTWDPELAKAAEIYRHYHLKLSYIVEPVDNRVKDIDGYMAAATHHAEHVARDYKDIVPFFELGNEPDIGFFQGPISLYADQYLKLRAAIKKGNPDAIVMNGGWAYGVDRIAEFYSIVKPADIDAIAYHGHGDVLSEEAAYRRVRAIAAKAGCVDKPMIDTESGIMAVSTPQEEIQARVCVEKFAFVQSTGAPFFNWFRLFFEHPDNYGSTIDHIQPRPSVLSYRATVETLRGYKFKQTLELPYNDTEAYLFEQIDGPGRACVLWVDGHSQRAAYLRVAEAAADAHDITTADIYGNHQPFELQQGGIAALTISEAPTWLCWSAGHPFAVAVAPPLITAPPSAEFHVNSTNPLVVQVRNPLDKPVTATLDVKAVTDAQLTVQPTHSTLQLAPQEEKRIDLTAIVGDVHNAITWPSQWTVFVRTAASIDPATITSIPDTLPGDSGPIKPTLEIERDGTIDLARLSNYKHGEEKLPALVMGYVDSIDDRTVTIGAGADFWMAWYVNGKLAFDDLAAGNGPGYTMFDHPFEIHLNKGRNLLVGKILAGSHGFMLGLGSPDELEKASGVSTRNSLQLSYSYDGGKPIVQALGIEFLHPIDSLGTLSFEGSVEPWQQSVPDIVLADRNIVNLHFKDPDSSLWWKGFGDLSATAWMRADEKNLYLLIKVVDDINRPAADPSQLSTSDSVALAFSPNGKEITQYRIGAIGDHTVVAKCGAGNAIEVVPDSNDDIHATVNRVDTSTFYKIRLSKHLTGDAYYMNFLINDNDAGIRKQYLEWKPGMETLTNPTSWYRVTF